MNKHVTRVDLQPLGFQQMLLAVGYLPLVTHLAADSLLGQFVEKFFQLGGKPIKK